LQKLLEWKSICFFKIKINSCSKTDINNIFRKISLRSLQPFTLSGLHCIHSIRIGLSLVWMCVQLLSLLGWFVKNEVSKKLFSLKIPTALYLSYFFQLIYNKIAFLNSPHSEKNYGAAKHKNFYKPNIAVYYVFYLFTAH